MKMPKTRTIRRPGDAVAAMKEAAKLNPEMDSEALAEEMMERYFSCADRKRAGRPVKADFVGFCAWAARL